jgi:hypothetical protein
MSESGEQQNNHPEGHPDAPERWDTAKTVHNILHNEEVQRIIEGVSVTIMSFPEEGSKDVQIARYGFVRGCVSMAVTLLVQMAAFEELITDELLEEAVNGEEGDDEDDEDEDA